MTTCKKCGKQMETSEFEQFFSNPEEMICAECKKEEVKKAEENKENFAVNQEEVF